MGATSPRTIRLSAERAAEAGGDASPSAGARTASRTSSEGWRIVPILFVLHPTCWFLPPAVFYLDKISVFQLGFLLDGIGFTRQHFPPKEQRKWFGMSLYLCSRKWLHWPFTLISCCHLSPQVTLLFSKNFARGCKSGDPPVNKTVCKKNMRK